jgi:pyruvate/2-oxoglutarate dehydrogenase complex dihydrolipoamide dehydrogenase (E3) component
LNVAIIGGGLVGVEAALNVVLQGGQATIIEKYDELAKQSYRANKQHLIYLLKQNKIQTYLNTEVISSNGSALFCKDKDLNEFVVDYNSISFCVGMLPNSLEFEEMENVLTIGDADNVDNVMNAVWTAFRKSRLI